MLSRNLIEPVGVSQETRTEEERISVTEDDADVLARVRGGDREAYAELVRRHAPSAARTASLLGAGCDAEDVVQEAFVKAFAALADFRDGAAFRPWLLRIVANETHNLHRASGRRTIRERLAWQRTERLLVAEAVDPAEAALTHERRAELVRGLATLSAAHRDVIICRYLLELSESETAEVLGWSLGTVKSRSHRGLKQLSRALGRGALNPTEDSHSSGTEVAHGS